MLDLATTFGRSATSSETRWTCWTAPEDRSSPRAHDHGKAELVVQDAEAYQALLDRVEAIEGIQRGLADVKAGRTKPARQVFARLRRKHDYRVEIARNAEAELEECTSGSWRGRLSKAPSGSMASSGPFFPSINTRSAVPSRRRASTGSARPRTELRAQTSRLSRLLHRRRHEPARARGTRKAWREKAASAWANWTTSLIWNDPLSSPDLSMVAWQ